MVDSDILTSNGNFIEFYRWINLFYRMAVLEKLLIRGVRSFGPATNDYDGEVIDFESPLTVIVGQNGTGKTV